MHALLVHSLVCFELSLDDVDDSFGDCFSLCMIMENTDWNGEERLADLEIGSDYARLIRQHARRSYSAWNLDNLRELIFTKMSKLRRRRKSLPGQGYAAILYEDDKRLVKGRRGSSRQWEARSFVHTATA